MTLCDLRTRQARSPVAFILILVPSDIAMAVKDGEQCCSDSGPLSPEAHT